MNVRIEIQSKVKIQSIRRIIENISKCHTNYKTVSKDWSIAECIKILEESLKQLETKSQNIEAKINRKERKLFFFGSISVGKSKIINTLLGMELLVTAHSHSTCCFVHLRKSQNSKWIIKYPHNEKTYDNYNEFIKKLQELSSCHDLENMNSLTSNESVECFVVCNDKKIFQDNTEIVDCPGSANTQDITQCIKQHSLDSDIFVFVIKSAITDDDRLFFNYQSDLSTKPDIFILVNGCDIGDNDNEDINLKSMAKIREECRIFLQKYYNDCKEINKRIFFISATEMWNFRKNGSIKKKQTEKQKERYNEFERFENSLTNYMDNFSKFKLIQYDKDISALTSDLDNLFERFSKDINNAKNQLILDNYQRKMNELDTLKRRITENCENYKSLMEIDVYKFDLVDCFNLDVLNNEFKNQNKNFDEQSLNFASNQGDEISDFLKAEELDNKFQYNWEKKLQFLLENFKDDKLKVPLKKDDNSTSRIVARVLSIIPIISIIATNIAISKEEKAAENNEKFKKEYMENLEKEFKSLHEKKLKIIEDNLKIIENEIHSNIKVIQGKIQEMINKYHDYWKEINNLLQSFK